MKNSKRTLTPAIFPPELEKNVLFKVDRVNFQISRVAGGALAWMAAGRLSTKASVNLKMGSSNRKPFEVDNFPGVHSTQ